MMNGFVKIEARQADLAIDAVLRKAIDEQVLALLRSFRKRGTIEQTGLGRGVRWHVAKVQATEFLKFGSGSHF